MKDCAGTSERSFPLSTLAFVGNSTSSTTVAQYGLGQVELTLNPTS